jgi:hypothetical protein
LTNSKALRSSLVAPLMADDVTIPAPDEPLTTRGLDENVAVSPEAVIIRATGRTEGVCAWLRRVLPVIRKREKAPNSSSRGSL